MHVGDAIAAALEFVGQPFVIDAEQMPQRSVQVVNVDSVLSDVVAELAGLAVDVASRRRGSVNSEKCSLIAELGLGTMLILRQSCNLIAQHPAKPNPQIVTPQLSQAA